MNEYALLAVFWTFAALTAGLSFAAITIVVTIKGGRDLRELFRGLIEQREKARGIILPGRCGFGLPRTARHSTPASARSIGTGTESRWSLERHTDCDPDSDIADRNKRAPAETGA